MGKQRFYDTKGIDLKLGNVVERIRGEGKKGLFTITGIKMEKWDNGVTSHLYQLDENDKDWVPSGFIRLFTDPNTVNNIAGWLEDNLSNYLSVKNGEAVCSTTLIDDMRNKFIPKNEEED